MVENPHELAEVNVGNARVAADHEHVFVVGPLRRMAEVGRPRNGERIIRKRIDQHELVVDVVVRIQRIAALLQKIRQCVSTQISTGREQYVSISSDDFSIAEIVVLDDVTQHASTV